MKIKPLKLSLSAILGIAVMAPVVAQDGVIEEVFVTATKRQQTLQEVPIAVSVTDSETIEKAQILDIKDLQTLVPSLRITQLQSSANTNFVIRGFGNGANNAGIEPSVGVFIDGVYRSRSAGAISDLPKLQRVEVLRGPQSTLFGKNASAGVISVITPKPSLDFAGMGEVTVGNYGQIVVKGEVTGGITDTLAGSISGSYNQRDGYFDNIATGADVNNKDRSSLRGQLLWTPTENTEFRLIADTNTLDENCCGVTNILNGPTGAAVQLIGGSLVPNSPFSYAYATNSESTNELDDSGISLQADIDFENVRFTSITSYRSQELNTAQDSDFTSASILGSNTLDQDIDTVTQEFRISNNDTSGNVDWLLGTFFFREDVRADSDIRYGAGARPYFDTLAAVVLGAPGAIDGAEDFLGFTRGDFLAAGDGSNELALQEGKADTIFGQVDWHLSDELTMTLGLSHTRDEKDINLVQFNNDTYNTVDFNDATGLADTFLINNFGTSDRALITGAGFGAFVAFADGTAPTLAPLSAIQFLPQLVNFPNSVESGESRDSATTYTIRLAYDANDSTNIYGSVATGFKATSWNLSRDSRPFDTQAIIDAGLGTVNINQGTRFASPEDAIVFEMGLKKRFDRGALNVAVFNQSIEGFQSNIFRGTGFVLANAGKQTSTGFEFDSTFDATENLTLGLSGTLISAIYDSFEEATGINGTVDLSGRSVKGIHPISLVANANYDFVLSNGWDAYVRADYAYESNVGVVDNVPTDLLSRQVNELNGSFGIELPTGWAVSLWGRNLTDNQYFYSGFPTPLQAGSFNAYPNTPRTYGVSVRKDF